jgi:deazaflavin-dependent oxidoreductase (nitroreductase family)
VRTIKGPLDKRRVVAATQKYILNPPIRFALRRRIPLGWCLLETRGRKTGLLRTVPVGNGLVGDTFWIVAEHGDRADYVRNIRQNGAVRVLLYDGGLRMRWVDGTATVLDDDDPYTRQRMLGGWRHPLRALNALGVRTLGGELRTVRVDLHR